MAKKVGIKEEYAVSADLVLRENRHQDPPIRIEYITRKHRDHIIKYIKDKYLPRCYIWNLLDVNDEALEEYINLVCNWLEAGASIIAIDNKTDNMLGFIIGEVWEKTNFQRELKRWIQFKTSQGQAVSHLFHGYHENVDLFLVCNINTLYNIYLWVVDTSLKNHAYITYELLASLIHFCDLLGAGLISAMLHRKEEKRFAEFMGFKVAAEIYYPESFNNVLGISKKIVKKEYYGYFMTYLISGEEREKLFQSSHKNYILPTVLKLRSKCKERRKMQRTHWIQLNSNFRNLYPDIIIV